MDTGDRVIYLGTFSKVLFPALRLGYVVVPHELIPRFIRMREALDLFSPLLYQLVLTDFLREGHFARHLRRMRAIYLARRNALIAAIREHAGDVLTIENTDAGLHLVTFIPEGVDDLEVDELRGGVRPVSSTPLRLLCSGSEPGRADPGIRRRQRAGPRRGRANAGRARQGLPPAPDAKVALNVGRTGLQWRLNSPV